VPIVILFGTETGTAEFVAYELTDRADAFADAVVCDMADCDVNGLGAENFYLVVCSTHEEGGLPETAQPFYESLNSESPDLVGVRYAMFGMGDTHYSETYNFGSATIDEKLTELGGCRVGEFGYHDASSKESASDAALAWAEGIVPLIGRSS
jgi:MioC protein